MSRKVITSRRIWLAATMIGALAVGLITMLASPTETQANIVVRFGLPGHPIDPPGMAGGGATRDRNEPPVVLLSSGATLDIVNAGAPHRIAIYDKGLMKNDSTPTTTFVDIFRMAGTGNFLDDPEGRLFLGAPGASASWTFTNTTGQVEQYLIICAFRPHFNNYGQSTFVLVRP